MRKDSGDQGAGVVGKRCGGYYVCTLKRVQSISVAHQAREREKNKKTLQCLKISPAHEMVQNFSYQYKTLKQQQNLPHIAKLSCVLWLLRGSKISHRNLVIGQLALLECY